MFEALGLTRAEEAIWQSLVDRPPAIAAELRDSEGLSARAVAATLASLRAKGLVIVLSGRPIRYTAAAPDIALDVLIRAKEEEVRRTRLLTGQVMERYRSGRRAAAPEDVVEVVRGAEAVFQRWCQIQRAARTELCALDRPPYLTDTNPYEVELLNSGVRFRAVYDSAVLDLPGRLAAIEAMMRRGEQARVGAVPVKFLLADDRIGMISLQHPATTDAVLVVHSSSLLVALRGLFDAIWRTSVPVATGSSGDELDPDDRRLLTYLAAGMTDDAIARQLGWHLRTVQRRVRRLMSELGVRTRFQAGLHAARRGWL
ncbi:helix-turn-helix domain-containing protein [Micromonospora sp. NPDC005173]|uniref:helix-turn-helix domain-containing protein n=1 Tax=Micromonospora sp. NPDC005173 TaxID=3157165 RepID=UPI0033AF5AC7